jgi:hypothetical protein
MKKIILLSLLLAPVLLFSQPNTEYLWTIGIGGDDDDYLNDFTSDNEGNLYFSLITESSQVWYNSFPFPENSEATISKCNSNGELQWTFPATSTNYINFTGLKISSDQELFAFGNFKGTVQFGDTTIIDTTGQYNTTSFLLKMDILGNFQWVRNIPGVIVYDCDMDSEDNVYFTGMNLSPVNIIGNDTIVNYSDWDLIIIKCDRYGNVIWANHAGSDQNAFTRGRSITVDNQDNIIVGGDYHGTFFIYNQDTINNPFENHLILMKLTNEGNLLWLNLPHGDSQTYISDIKSDSEGNVYATGDISGEFSFDTIHVSLSIYDQFFLVKYDGGGSIQWLVTSESTNGEAKGNSLDFDREGNIFLTGKFNRTVHFGNFTLSTSYYLDFDGFLLKMKPEGTFDWIMKIPNCTYLNDYAYRKVLIDNNENIVISGIFTQNSIFGNDTLNWIGLNDVYFSKLHEITTSVQPKENKSKISVFAGIQNIHLTNISPEEKYILEIYDVTGRQIITTSVNYQHRFALKFSQPSGMYLVHLFNERSHYTGKVWYNN